jgi:hypothetical protein
MDTATICLICSKLPGTLGQKKIHSFLFLLVPKHPPKPDHDLEMIRVVTAAEGASMTWY